MIYSVWSHANRAYDYYRTPERREEINSPKPKHLRFGQLGVAPEDAAWPLPADAVWFGRGRYPKGHIASVRGATQALEGILGMDLTVTNMAMLALSGFLVWRYVLKPRSA